VTQVGGFQVARLRVDLVPDTEGQHVEQDRLIGLKAPREQVVPDLRQQSLRPLAGILQRSEPSHVVKVRGGDGARLLTRGDPDASLVADLVVSSAVPMTIQRA
jgi:hypothetical protein